MRIAVISDLHLGRGGPADDFGHEDGAFLCFLDYLEAGHERIVLLGDVYETWSSPLPGRPAVELAAIRKAHPRLCARFDGPGYHAVIGNHDPVAARALGTADELCWELSGRRYLFLHGHQLDWLIGRAPLLSAAGIWSGAWLRRLGARGAFHRLQHLDARLRGTTPTQAVNGPAHRALHLARRRGADVLVVGHTHHPHRLEAYGHLVVNAGSCWRGQFQWVSLDTAEGGAELIRGWAG